MLTRIHGVFRNGHIELAESPAGMPDGSKVIVTFLAPEQIDLRDHEIEPEEAAELRARLSSFAEDWDSTEMDVYDKYDDAQSNT